MSYYYSKASVGGGPTYLVNQGFEGTGYDNGETWNLTGGTVDPDYTTAPLVGSHSLRVNSDSFTGIAFTPQTTAEAYCRIEFATLPTVACAALTLYDETGTTLRVGIMFSANEVRIRVGGTESSASATTTLTSTLYFVKIRHESSGTNKIWLSTDGTWVDADGSGRVYLTMAGAAGSAGQVYVGGASGTLDFKVDQVLVDNAVIGDNP